MISSGLDNITFNLQIGKVYIFFITILFFDLNHLFDKTPISFFYVLQALIKAFFKEIMYHLEKRPSGSQCQRTGLV